MKWLTEVFIPHTKPDNEDQWRLLILDGHGSHKSEEFLLLCLINKIWILFLPAHSSHVFQPLDVGVFAVLKRKYRSYLRNRLFGRLSEDVEKEDFLYAISKAWYFTMQPKYMGVGWRCSGSWPVDRNEPARNPYLTFGGAERTLPSVVPVTSLIPPDFASQMSGIVITTPRSSREVYSVKSQLTSFNPAFKSPTCRLLFRKIGKALDDRISQLATAELKVQQLTAALERARPKKRRKVIADPNEEFVRLKRVREVKEDIREGRRAPRSVTRQNQQEEVPVQASVGDEGTQECIEVHGSDSEEDWSTSDGDMRE